MEIIKLKPAFKDYLWGGTNLRDKWGKQSDLQRLAESWELSAHPDGESTVFGGRDDGLSFSAYLEKHREQVLGKNPAQFEKFPVLIKLIDAKQPLSVQVHPSDEYALRVEGEYGKTEMWYVADCEPGAFLYFGVNRAITPEEFRSRIADNSITEVLGRVDVKKGDVFFIESGTIHAIGAGILICEIQQNSNTTYRVYDYARRDDAGNLRELHVEKAMAVSRLTPSDTADRQEAPLRIPGGTKARLAACKYFTTDKYTVQGEVTLEVDENSFASLMVLTGTGTVTGPENSIAFAKGDSLFIPAGTGKVTINGDCGLIKTTV